MKTNNTKKNRNDTRSAKVNRDQKNCKKEPYIPDLFDKPAIEVAEVGVPLDMEACPGTDSNEPTLVDKEHYGKIYTVTDGSFYTIRLGIHSSSLGVGSMNEETRCYRVWLRAPGPITGSCGLLQAVVSCLLFGAGK